MSEFRKKPVVIDAVQWFKHGDHPHVRAFADSDHLYFTGMGGVTVTDHRNLGVIETLESPSHLVQPGDWIITGVKDEHYACKPDIFAMTYEPEDTRAPSTTSAGLPLPSAIDGPSPTDRNPSRTFRGEFCTLLSNLQMEWHRAGAEEGSQGIDNAYEELQKFVQRIAAIKSAGVDEVARDAETELRSAYLVMLNHTKPGTCGRQSIEMFHKGIFPELYDEPKDHCPYCLSWTGGPLMHCDGGYKNEIKLPFITESQAKLVRDNAIQSAARGEG